MCANCVSSIDAAAAAVGGVAGLRLWLGSIKARAAPRRAWIAATVLLVGVLGLLVAAVALASHA
jgi:hypothetical protein